MPQVLKVVKSGKRNKLVYAKKSDVLDDRFEGLAGPIESQHLLISYLLPPAVKEFIRQIEREVDGLCGKRYAHDGSGNQRWGNQKGSIILANQQIAVERPRVRSKDGREVPLRTYEEFQNPELFDEAVFTEGLKRVSQRDYQKGMKKIANSFGFKKSAVSKRWIKATAGKIAELQTRSLKEFDIRAVFIDGKKFSKYGVMIALGVSSSGRKYVLGIYQCASEDHQSCLNLLNDLQSRGLPSEGLLFVVDGGSGINKALEMKYNCSNRAERRAVRLRCYLHKWRNLESVLGDRANKAATLFWAIREARDMSEARRCSDALEAVLRDLNLSALESYREAKDDLLALHELNIRASLRTFFSTTNPIESLNSLIEEDMRRVKKWQDSSHFQRWCATYCLANEKRMRRVRGYQELPALWVRLATLTAREKEIDLEVQTA